MTTFLELLIKFYHAIYAQLGVEVLNEMTTTWIMRFDNGFTTVIVWLLIMNVIHRPSKYRFKLFFAPTWAQIVMRNIVFINIIFNPVIIFGMAIIFFFFAMRHLMTMSRFNMDTDIKNPFTAFFS